MDYMPLLRPFTTEQLVRAQTYFDEVERLGGRGSPEADILYDDGPCLVDRLVGCEGAGDRRYKEVGDIERLVDAAWPAWRNEQYADLRRDLDILLAERGIPDGGKEVSPKRSAHVAEVS